MKIRRKLLSLFAAALLAVSPAAGFFEQVQPAVHVYAADETAKADHSELLTMCRGHYAYDDLGAMENGAALQKFYNKLFDVYSEVWTSSKDYSYYTGTTMYLIGRIELDDYGLSLEEAIACYYAFRDDNPVIYYAMNSYAKIEKTATKGAIFFPRINDQYAKAADRKKLQQDIYDYVIKMTEPTKSFTRRFERSLILHDKMLPLMEYNYDAVTIGNKKAQGKTLTSDEDDIFTYSHNIIGAVEYKSGVCESYAKTYQMLLEYIDIDNVYIIGTDVSTGGGHAWNAVKMDNGTYYLVDVTWDDKIETHKYFAKGYTVFDEGHIVKSSVKTGVDYFYSLPDIPQGDYSCQANSPTLYTQMSNFAFYINENNTATVTRYLGTASKVTIPPTIMGFKVTGIGPDAFFNKTTVKEIVIPEGITDIGRGAAFISGLSSVTIPKSVTAVDDYAFGWRHNSAVKYYFDGDYSGLSPVKVSGFTIYCYKNSAGYRYAVNNGINYVLLDDTADVTLGDVNDDDKINIKDVMLIQQFIVGWKVSLEEAAADVNGDSKVNIKDVMLIQQYIVGWNVTFKAA